MVWLEYKFISWLGEKNDQKWRKRGNKKLRRKRNKKKKTYTEKKKKPSVIICILEWISCNNSQYARIASCSLHNTHYKPIKFCCCYCTTTLIRLNAKFYTNEASKISYFTHTHGSTTTRRLSRFAYIPYMTQFNIRVQVIISMIAQTNQTRVIQLYGFIQKSR